MNVTKEKIVEIIESQIWYYEHLAKNLSECVNENPALMRDIVYYNGAANSLKHTLCMIKKAEYEEE